MVTEHLVAHTRRGFRGLTNPAVAGPLWSRLWDRVPGILALVFMPDHVHLMAIPGAAEAFRRTVARTRGVSFDVAPPTPAMSTAIAGRQIRYVFANPIRGGYCDDPYAWTWSRLRWAGASGE